MDEDEDVPFPTVPGLSNHPNQVNPDYDSRASRETLDLEMQLHPNEDPVQRAKRLLREAVDGAASTLIEIALHGSTEKLRLDAARMILDRVIGPANLVQPADDESPLERMLKELEVAANG